MCIAIRKPKKFILKRSTLEQCYQSNPHGAGFAVLTSKGLVVKKGFFTFEDFWHAWQPYQKCFALVHFRIRTAGRTDAFNCHPWEFTAGGKRFALIHNGVLQHRSSPEMSDTGHFVQDIIIPRCEKNPDYFFTKAGHDFLVKAIGGGNKMVLLREDGRVGIFNRNKGLTVQGCWFSNTSFQPRVYSPTRWTTDGYGNVESRGRSSCTNTAACEQEDTHEETAYEHDLALEERRLAALERARATNRVAPEHVDAVIDDRQGLMNLGDAFKTAKDAFTQRLEEREAQMAKATEALLARVPKVHGPYKLPSFYTKK